ncbi:MAG: hypothetical protein KIT31_19995 [Deltaproteobacteria bacterium]|nr:hypothetical protein [Deltaproteobacteria bacterium]
MGGTARDAGAVAAAVGGGDITIVASFLSGALFAVGAGCAGAGVGAGAAASAASMFGAGA